MLFQLAKANISKLTLFFKDKTLNKEYIESYQKEYIRTIRLISIVINFFTLIMDLIYLYISDSEFKYIILVINIIFGFAFFISTYFSFFKLILTQFIFLTHIITGIWTIEIMKDYHGSILIILQLIVTLTIFPRNYFLLSVIANSIIFTFLFITKTKLENFDFNILLEMFFLLIIIFYLELSSYLKEITNKKDFLNSKKIKEQEEKTSQLLENTLPKEIANELKSKGSVDPKEYLDTSILFTDFKNFTKITEDLTPSELLKELDGYFFQFDEISKRYNIEKLKTIGDSYMCVAGIPIKNNTHAIDACLAALEIQKMMNQMKKIKSEMNLPFWELRVGIHSGEVIGGVIGKTKFAFDIWGDSVNLASRMESAGEVGKVNISEETYNRVKDFFDFEFRGEIAIKNKGEVKMYFIVQIKPELSLDGKGFVPNDKFNMMYDNL